MEERTARELICRTGRELLETGLVARTWGNVSSRLDPNHFLITPSGLDYHKTQPQDIVRVELSTMTWEGSRKPSGERGVHAAAYKVFPEANFVIHTHNRKFTFQSAANVPRAMLLVFLFYVLFAPFTSWNEHFLADTHGWNEYAVLAINMALNLSLEYLWDNFVVYRNSKDTNDIAKKKQGKEQQHE